MAQDSEEVRKKQIEEKSLTLIKNLVLLRAGFFSTESELRDHHALSVVGWLEKYYAEMREDRNFEPAVRALERRRECGDYYQICAMIRYADQVIQERGQQWGGVSGALLSTKIPEMSEIQLGIKREREELKQIQAGNTHSASFISRPTPLLPPPPFLRKLYDAREDSDSSSSDSSEEKEETTPFSCINCRSPENQIKAGFFMFAVGALQVTGSIMLALLLVGSVIPFLGATAPLAIAGCGLAGFAFVSGLMTMGAGIKLGLNAFGFFPSSFTTEEEQNGERYHIEFKVFNRN